MPNDRKDNRNWKIAITTVAAAAIGALSYYLGYVVAKEEEEENACKASQPGTSSSTNPHSESTEQCSICLKTMKPLKHLHCGHYFHDECVSQWLPLSSTCPLCRAKQEPDSL